MDKEIALMIAKEIQIFQGQYKQVLGTLQLVPFDPNVVKQSLNNLGTQKRVMDGNKKKLKQISLLDFKICYFQDIGIRKQVRYFPKAQFTLPVKMATVPISKIPTKQPDCRKEQLMPKQKI